MKEKSKKPVKIRKSMKKDAYPPIDDLLDADVFSSSAMEQLSPEVKRLLENF
jgi:hypothetical protein